MSIEGLYAQPILHLAREARDRAPVLRPTTFPGGTFAITPFIQERIEEIIHEQRRWYQATTA